MNNETLHASIRARFTLINEQVPRSPERKPGVPPQAPVDTLNDVDLPPREEPAKIDDPRAPSN